MDKSVCSIHEEYQIFKCDFPITVIVNSINFGDETSASIQICTNIS
jgi:hypothetical protein